MNIVAHIQPIFTLLAVFILATFGTGCAEKADQHSEQKNIPKVSLDKVGQEWDSFTDSIANYSFKQREEIMDSIENQVEMLDNKAEALENELADTTQAAGAEIENAKDMALQELRKQSKELKQWSQKIDQSTENAWEEVKYDFSQSYTAMQKALSEIEDAIDSDNA